MDQCKRCPHHVKHGQVAADGKTIEFLNRCGLMMKANKVLDCVHHPFSKYFDYTSCGIYQETFKSSGIKNDVVPTKDFQYSEGFNSGSITDMELL